MRKHVLRALLICGSALILAILAITVIPASGPGNQATAGSPGAVTERKIDALISRMTLPEKLGQFQMLDADFPTGKLTDAQLAMVKAGTLGSTLNGRGAQNTNDAQRVAVEQSRLKIPLIFGFDVIHGYRTVFPAPLGEASTFDASDARTSAAVAADEARAAGVTWTFAPMVDIARDPRWGRVVEGAGEDPFLGSAFATARVQGFQGDDYSQPNRVAATAKHFAGYGGAEGGRDYNTVDVSDQRLRELYLPPFKATIDAGVDTVMPSFNELSGVPSTANPYLLRQILRKEWREDGPTVSDYTAVHELIQHGVAADACDAARVAINAGTDIEMVSHDYADCLPQLVAAHQVSMRTIDDAVRRVLRLKFRAGLFEHPYVDPAREPASLLSPEHRAQARRIAGRSMVLLRNEGNALPLASSAKNVAVVGPLADDQENMLGSWTGDGKPQDVVPVLDGLKAGLGQDANVTYAKGCTAECTSSDGFGEAVNAAQAADTTVVVLGEPASYSGEASARAHLGLPGQQLDLVKAIAATGKPYVVVLMNGRPLTIDWLAEHAPAILEAWYPGTEAGNAVADVLLGKVNPGGKLPITFPRDVGQIPLTYDHKNTGRPADPDNKYTSKYLDEPVTPLYPFGFGLSYTSFTLGDLQLSAPAIPRNGSLTVTANVTNTGSRAGDEVVQLYVHDKVASVTRPVKALKGFSRVALEPGQSKPVTFTLGPKELGLVGSDSRFVVEPGDFDLWVATSSDDEGLKGTFSVR